MKIELPTEVASRLPDGYQLTSGVWLVLPHADIDRDGIVTMNAWLRGQDWYPPSLQDVVWFGDDGVGNLLGWRPQQGLAILWNPEDGDQPWKEGSVTDLWQFVINGYL